MDLFELPEFYIRVCQADIGERTTTNRRVEGLLETVLFANIRFHDTVSRGRLLNRFGKDFEGDDSVTLLFVFAYICPTGRH
jgi:hypothetical protein